jgi:hypothetical protein
MMHARAAQNETRLNEHTIMEQTGHKTTTMVRRYMRRGSLFRNNAAAKVGL